MALVDPSHLLSITDAAKRLPNSEISLRRLVKLGRIPVVRIGRNLFLHADTVAALLTQSAPRQ